MVEGESSYKTYCGTAAKLTASKITLTNGKTVTVNFTINNKGSTYAYSRISVWYGANRPQTGNNGINKNATRLTDFLTINTTTSVSAKFTGTTGSYYLYVLLEANAGSGQSYSESSLGIGGQVTLTSITIS